LNSPKRGKHLSSQLHLISITERRQTSWLVAPPENGEPARAGSPRRWEHQEIRLLTTVFNAVPDAHGLAQAIVDTVRESLLVLDGDLRVLAANRAFYTTFATKPEETEGLPIYSLCGGQWNIPALRTLLEKILPERRVMEDFEVVGDFPNIGRRTMLLNARKVFYEGQSNTTLLLAFEDITLRRAIELQKEALIKQTQDLLNDNSILLQEMQHRIGNSLQIIASILMLKAGSVASEEARSHLHDAHRRVMSVAAVQRHLKGSGKAELVDIAPYLTELCATLASSMISDSRPVALRMRSHDAVTGSTFAVNLGLIVTELVINALKHAFPADRQNCQVNAEYRTEGSNWELTVSDNGVGIAEDLTKDRKVGLGTNLVQALSQHLDAEVDITSGPGGVNVVITHGVMTPALADSSNNGVAVADTAPAALGAMGSP
jgi:two-component sensor histidine kinase